MFPSDLFVCCSMFELSCMWEEARQILPISHQALQRPAVALCPLRLVCREHIVVFQQQWVTAGEPPENRLTARLQKPLADPSVGFVGSVLSSVELTLHSEYGHLRSIRSLDSRARLNFRQCQMKCFRCLTHYIIDQYVLQLYHFDPFCQYFAYVFS